MPKVSQIGPYRLYFFSHEPHEPPHVHVKREKFEVKLWLDPVEVAANHRFPRQEVTRIARIVREHQATLLEKWYGYFGQK